jgi:predicted glycoside hydrolase/deacetylase ChbG (UPF0249 family)
MVRWPAAAAAAAYSRDHPELSLGLHFDLSEWAYREDAWVRLYEVVPEDDLAAVTFEATRQLAAFRRLVGTDPTHVDSHQHVHRNGAANVVLTEMARNLGVPLRSCQSEIRYCGDFYGQTGKGEPLPEAISVDRLIRILVTLQPGLTELACHPGLGDDLNTMYGRERAEEVKALCDLRVRAALAVERIELRSFADMAGCKPPVQASHGAPAKG